MGKKRPTGKSNKSAYQFNLDRIQLFFLISGSLLTLVMCFSLGLMLGYQLSGTSLKEQLPSREEIDSLVKKSQNSSFYETLVEPLKESPKKKPTAKKKSTAKKKPIAKKKTTASQSKLRAGATKDYAIQVAAFKNRKLAYKLRDELKEEGYPAYVQTAQGKTNRWFRVRLGKYATRQQARQAVEQIKQQTKLKPFIVQ